MSLTINHQKPARLDPIHTIALSGDYDPVAAVTTTMIEPLYEPFGQTPVQIVDAQGNDFILEDAVNTFMSLLGENVNPSSETTMKELYGQGLIHYDGKTNLLANEVFVVQAATKEKMPRPGPNTIYTAGSDVSPAAKALLAGSGTADAFFASLGYVYAPETLGFWFQSETAFDDFTTWLAQQTHILGPVLPQRTVALLNEFNKTTLKNLTESLILRASDDTENEEYSFARTLVHMLMTYQQQQNAAGNTDLVGTMAFNVSELFLPRTLVLANIESHARSSAKKIDNEWRLIKASIASPIKVVSNKSLSKLTALPRAAQKAAAQAANAQSNRQQQKGRSALVKFRKQAPNSVDIYTGLIRALKRLKQVNQSQNVFKKTKNTFTKANRRDPDDYNKPGTTTSTHYLPDIHIYLDCSGSINEDNYQQAIKMLIQMAKKLNVNLYFTSFSHIMSKEKMLRIQNRSLRSIWNEFQRTPKVTGGTEFSQIWKYINMSRKRKERLSLVITDFGWTAPSQREEHPKNLYYAPVSNMDWNSIKWMAENFEKSMHHIEPSIAQRMIGIIV